ncbi:hypothetical protein PYCCODRAFT_1266713 [Trametes coccinea BRFM310]|uniref:Uncharacterized protein n=1 Tax=Trametes coccinea (strain BRFM310) TaxID=1353009 RepID=A0A1Y2I608_TRAC3|nr:hypothetical protein PYCCODRAFT_1266713 [Trametes coccinea BRFM310]
MIVLPGPRTATVQRAGSSCESDHRVTVAAISNYCCHSPLQDCSNRSSGVRRAGTTKLHISSHCVPSLGLLSKIARQDDQLDAVLSVAWTGCLMSICSIFVQSSRDDPPTPTPELASRRCQANTSDNKRWMLSRARERCSPSSPRTPTTWGVATYATLSPSLVSSPPFDMIERHVSVSSVTSSRPRS